MVLTGDCNMFNFFSKLLISAYNILVFGSGILLDSDKDIL